MSAISNFSNTEWIAKLEADPEDTIYRATPVSFRGHNGRKPLFAKEYLCITAGYLLERGVYYKNKSEISEKIYPLRLVCDPSIKRQPIFADQRSKKMEENARKIIFYFIRYARLKLVSGESIKKIEDVPLEYSVELFSRGHVYGCKFGWGDVSTPTFYNAISNALFYFLREYQAEKNNARALVGTTVFSVLNEYGVLADLCRLISDYVSPILAMDIPEPDPLPE